MSILFLIFKGISLLFVTLILLLGCLFLITLVRIFIKAMFSAIHVQVSKGATNGRTKRR